MYRSLPLVAISLLFILNGCAKKPWASMKKDVTYLASDELGGRLTGTQDELEAAKYIQNEMSKAGLGPDLGPFLQTFPFKAGVGLVQDSPNRMLVSTSAGSFFSLETDKTYPLPYSATRRYTAKVIDCGYGLVNPSHSIDEFQGIARAEPGRYLLINLGLPDTVNPHQAWLDDDGWRTRLANARKVYKPGGVLFYNSKDNLNVKASRAMTNISRDTISIWHLDEKAVYAAKHADTNRVTTTTFLQNLHGTGQNVVGYIDAGKTHTVIVGAHYDHLGSNRYGNSLSTEVAIHNGADDNASGTAVLLEVARRLGAENVKNSLPVNVLFIAFSGEELGLLGSKYYANNPRWGLGGVTAMINMDMVGRLRDSSKELVVFGGGTSPQWNSLLEVANKEKYLKITTKPEGQGPSDHTSFYLKDIPVVHLFTGAHSDYHKPSDDVKLLNMKGMDKVASFVVNLIQALPQDEKLAFTPTIAPSMGMSKFKVTLGIMPDYTYSDKGLRVDGVTAGKPASVAGLRTGDVIRKLGDVEVSDISAYMTALSKYRAGETAPITFERAGKVMQAEVKF